MAPSLTGFVLVGGRSTRMGSHKALIKVDGVTAVDRQCQLLEPICSSGVHVVGSYGADDTYQQWSQIDDFVGGQGPLDGILAALRKADGGLAIIVAVDLLAITSDVLRSLLPPMISDDSDNVDVAYAGWAQAMTTISEQPLCAVWRVATSYEPLQRAFMAGERSVIKAWLMLRRTLVEVPGITMLNVNSPSDLTQNMTLTNRG